MIITRQSQTNTVYRGAAASPIPVILTVAARLEVRIVGNAIFVFGVQPMLLKALTVEVLIFDVRLQAEGVTLRVLENGRPVHRLLRYIIALILPVPLSVPGLTIREQHRYARVVIVGIAC